MKKRYLLLSVVCSVFSAVVLFLALWLPGNYQVPVLMYHSVSPSWSEHLNNVTPERFAQQMAYLKTHGYKVISVHELVETIRSGRRPEDKSVVLTFDDGYENNHNYAFPVLQKIGFPAMVFLEVGNVGRESPLTKKKYLTWAQVREMSLAGIDFGSHLMSGSYMPPMSPQQRVWEIVESKKVLEKKLSHSVSYLAYPIGGFDDDIKRKVREAGYEAAFATNRGFDRRAKDLYELKRIRIKDGDRGLQLWLKLSGYYNLFRSSLNPF